jgi:eukaryotic-like serine/threonine-protein kinase
MTLQSGTRIGPYEILGPLGRGGMGEVWRARDTRLNREVAIKALPDAFARDADRLARFEREARLLASLNHPHIAGIYGLEQSDGQLLVLELVEGETLADRLARGAIPAEEAVRLALQIAEALEAAHDKGIIHRDLKPANIKVTPGGRVKVLDFGLAKALEAGPASGGIDLTQSPTLSIAATQQGLILGTAGYMSPEQASGGPADVRTDIWSFGVVLFEMLTGRQLFTGKTVSHVLAGVLRSDPDWHQLPANLHPRLRLLLERCLEKEPKDRAHHIADVRVDLQKVLADPAGVLARPSAPPARATSRTSLVAVAAAALAALVAGVAAWTLKPADPPPIIRFAHELSGGSDLRVIGYPALAVSPDGRRIVYNATDGLYLLSIDSLDARRIPGTEDPVANVMFSPDGEWLAFVNGTSLQFEKIPLTGGARVALVRQPIAAGEFWGASWTADHRILFGQGRTVSAVSANGGTPDVLFEIEEAGQPAFPELLPGGRSILFTLASAEGNQVAVRALDSAETKVLFPGTRPRYVPPGYIVYAAQNALFAHAFDLSRLTTLGTPVPLVEGVMDAGVAQYAISESGSLVYIRGAASPNRTLAIADAGATRILDVPPGLYSSPRVSPDGRRVVVQTTPPGATPITSPAATIWVYDLSGRTAIRQLTREGKNFQPIWTPDGTRVTFASDRDGPVSIYWQPADGSGPAERLTTAAEGTQHFPDSWSPDGRTLLYQVFSSTADIGLWSLSLDARDAPVPIATGTGRNHGGVFSPNGRWMAYGSTEGAPVEQIYVEPFPPTGVKYQITRAEGAFPIWAPDGRSLFFRRVPRGTEGTGTHLVQVEVSDAGPFEWRNERELPISGFLQFGGLRDYDVLPDGQRFVMVFPVRDASASSDRPRLHVVVNWVEELKARFR